MQPDLIPHIQQYAGAWSIYEPSAASFMSLIKGLDWTSHMREAQARMDDASNAWSGEGYEVTPEGIAVVDLEGVLTKYGSSLSRGGSTVTFRQRLRAISKAFDHGDVKACMLCIESGGGSTMGTPEAADEVAKLSSKMPVWTYFEDIGASAAYWIGSQASRVIANESALVGSIGTYFQINDLSAMFEKEGVKANLFTTGPHKGAGSMGVPLTEEQAAEFQSLVQRINAPFPEAIAKARGLAGDKINEVNDGRVWRGAEAVSLGLLDAVMSYDDALAELAASLTTNPGNSNTRNSKMSTKPKASSKIAPTKSTKIKSKSEEMEDEDDTSVEEDEVEETESMEDEDETEANEDEKKPKAKVKSKAQPGEKAASISDLKSALPDADSDFILGSLESGLSVQTARMNWLEQTVKSQKAEIDQLQSQGPKPGTKPLGGGKSSAKSFDGDAKSAWKSAVKEKTDAGMSKQAAVSALTKEQPELHSAYVEACNAR